VWTSISGSGTLGRGSETDGDGETGGELARHVAWLDAMPKSAVSESSPCGENDRQWPERLSSRRGAFCESTLTTVELCR
jgi:uncharacterized protein YodC (DUF2158 family)